MSVIDTKVKYLLNNWFFVKGQNHEIRLIFKEYDLTNVDKFLGYDKELIWDMRRQKNNVITPLNK